jgi:hypothetical protein
LNPAVIAFVASPFGVIVVGATFFASGVAAVVALLRAESVTSKVLEL